MEDVKKVEKKKEAWFRTKGETDRKNIGEISQDLLAKEPDTNDPIELQQEMQYSSFEDEFNQAFNRASGKYASDFYIVVINQRFRLFSNVIRTYFIDRISCPTPDYDQTVYRIEKKTGKIEFLWTIPDKNSCQDLYENALMLDPEYTQLLQYVLDFYDGTLLNKTKLLNKEDEQSLVLIS
jgi:hypothetical protein